MSHSRAACAFAGACAVGLAGALAVACDPKETPPAGDNGPPFLVIGRADTQPSWSGQGTTVYAQARGGNLLAIALSGCTSAFGDHPESSQSCGIVPYYSSQPLTFTIRTAVDQPCIIDARLYSVCDCPDAGSPADYSDGPSAFAWCASAGTLVTTTQVAIDPWLPSLILPADGGEDASAAASGDGALAYGDTSSSTAPVTQ